MTDSLSNAASQLRGIAEFVANSGARLRDADPGSGAFGAGAVGRLGELGQELHRQLDQRLREAAAQAAEYAQSVELTAQALVRAAGSYGDIDHAARQRLPEGA
jgi:hypothetical protein